MAELIVNGFSVDLPPDFVVRMVRNNSMFLEDVLEGDYSFPISLPATERNRNFFEFLDLPEANQTNYDLNCEYIESAVTIVRGKFFVKKGTRNQYECYVLSGLASLANIKELSIRDLQYGGERQITGDFQELNYTLTAPDGGGNVNFAYNNGVTTNITVAWNTNANLTLIDLKTQIDLLTPTKYPGRTVTVTVTGSVIKLVAEWQSGYPLLRALPMSGSWTAGFANVGHELTREVLQQHMNDVMSDPDASDYLFVPLYNLDSGLWDHSLTVPALFAEVFVNFYHLGSFHTDYRYNFTGIQATVQSPVCPFPKAFYVLKEILQTGGYAPSGNALSNAELANLLIYTPNCIHKADLASLMENNLYQLNFKIGGLLPKLTVADYIHSLRNTFGIHYFFNDTTRKCYVELFDTLVKDTMFIDWSHKIASEPTVVPAEPQGYKFVFEQDTNDACIEENLQPIDKLNRLPDVDQFSDLAALTPKPNDICWTRKEKVFYRATFNFWGPFIAWVFHSDHFHPLTIGSGKTEVNSKSGTLVMHRGIYSTGAPESWTVPKAKQKMNPLKPFEWEGEYSEFSLRFLFYRGFIEDSAGHAHPFASHKDLDYSNTEIAGTNYTMIWEGAKGLYKNFWEAFCLWRDKAKEVEYLIDMTIIDYINLDMRKKIQIHGVNYFIKKIDVAFPIKAPARVTFLKA
jgi:hypothetical protein